MLHQGHASVTKMDKLSEAFWWPGLYREIRENPKPALVAEQQVKILKQKPRLQR